MPDEKKEVVDDPPSDPPMSKSMALRKGLVEESQISLLLDSYDDLFSDFDPKPYSQRALSDDFLQEAKRASREIKPGVLELRFMLPAAARKEDLEQTITKRLHAHFRKHHDILDSEEKQVREKGIFLTLIGFLMMVLATFLSPYQQNGMFLRILFIIFEPAGWFSVWYGLDTIFYFSKERHTDALFYHKMSKAEISFHTY